MGAEGDRADRDRLQEENAGLKEEIAELRRRLSLFATEHRLIAWAAGLILAGPRLAASIRSWLLRASVSNPLPVEETAALGAAIVRRALSVGLVGLLLPTTLLVWQNCLIRDQNKYLREQTSEIRRQIALDDEQSDWVRRKDLLQVIYDGRKLGLSTRTRVEALKALVRVDNKLLDQGLLSGERVDLRAADFSCKPPGSPDCADLSSSWLVRVDFGGADFRGANLGMADLRYSSFIGADLSGAELVSAKLESTEFRDVAFSPPLVTALKSGDPLWLPEADGIAAENESLLRQLREIAESAGLDLIP